MSFRAKGSLSISSLASTPGGFYGISTTSASALSVLHDLYISQRFQAKLNKCSEAFSIELTCFSYNYELIDFLYTDDTNYTLLCNATFYERVPSNDKLMYEERIERIELQRVSHNVTVHKVQASTSKEELICMDIAKDSLPFCKPFSYFMDECYKKYWTQNPVCNCDSEVVHRDFGFPLSDPRHYAFGVHIIRIFPKELKRLAKVLDDIDTDTSGVLNVTKDETIMVNHALGRGLLFATRTVDDEGALCMSGTIPESFVQYL